MSEIDNMSPMTREQFKRKYVDTHTELTAMSSLPHKRNNITDPSDKNANKCNLLKKPYEAQGFVIRANKLNDYIYDGVEVRAEDILDKKQIPMKDLLKIAVSIAPKNININANVTNTFADLWNTIDVEGKDSID
jgi:hypothetical protein